MNSKEEFKSKYINKLGRLRGERSKEIEEFFKDDGRDLSTKEKAYLLLHDMDDRPLCSCGEPITRFLSMSEGYNKLCSGCAIKEGQEKAKKTCMDRYGVTNPMHNDTIKERLKASIVEKYGVEHYSKHEDFKSKIKETKANTNEEEWKRIREKYKKTCMDRYGVDYYSKTKKFSDAVKSTCREKYGVDHYLQSEDKHEKTKKSNLKKYGTEHHLQNEEVLLRQKETNIERYGVENVSMSQDISDRARNSKKANSYQRRKRALKDTHVFLFEEKEYVDTKERYFRFEFRCVECQTEYSDYFEDGNIPTCPVCFPPIKNPYSNPEKELIAFINALGIDLIENDRGVLGGKELDIYIPDKKIAIEFNGVYWHSSKFKDSSYHLEKTKECESKGIRLVHVFEDEWKNKRALVESMLSSILGETSNRIYARKCELRKLQYREVVGFLEMNHLQGAINTKVNYGLFYEDKLVSVMTFGKPRFDKKYEWELIRFANKMNYSVVGAGSKMLKKFREEYVPSSIMSYSNRTRGDSGFYEKIGFVLFNRTKPGYFYVNKNMQRKHRLQMSKKNQEKTMKRFEPELSEEENAMLNGWYKVWDCVQNVYVID